MLKIRSERPDDIAGIWRVNEQAFGRPGEAELVDALRRREAVRLSMVAELNGQVVGHILFSPVQIVSAESSVEAIALGPMAVLPDFQGQGIGSQLVRVGLDQCRRLGEELVFVLGHPDFYPRFGFRPTRPLGMSSEFDVPEEVFMVLELRGGALSGKEGTIIYAPEFRGV